MFKGVKIHLTFDQVLSCIPFVKWTKVAQNATAGWFPFSNNDSDEFCDALTELHRSYWCDLEQLLWFGLPVKISKTGFACRPVVKELLTHRRSQKEGGSSGIS